jgi:hypothetical protein
MRKLLALVCLLPSLAFAQFTIPQHTGAVAGGSAPSFPTQGILDTFTRANENPLSDGGKWTCAYFTANNLQLLSNAVKASTSSDGSCEWNVTTFGPESEAYVTVATLSSTADATAILFVRAASGTTGYLLFVCQANDATCDAGAGWAIIRLDSGLSSPVLLTSASSPISAGDSIGLLVKGSTITGYKKTGGVWGSVLSTTDSTYSAAGNIGLIIENDSSQGMTLTNFGGGTGTE